MGRPVVSTSVGAEGLELGDGLLRADTAPDFATAVLGVLADPDAATTMAARGQARVLTSYEWDVIAPHQARAWREAIQRGPQRARAS